jgi:hypothetical protein
MFNQNILTCCGCFPIYADFNTVTNKTCYLQISTGYKFQITPTKTEAKLLEALSLLII